MRPRTTPLTGVSGQPTASRRGTVWGRGVVEARLPASGRRDILAGISGRFREVSSPARVLIA